MSPNDDEFHRAHCLTLRGSQAPSHYRRPTPSLPLSANKTFEHAGAGQSARTELDSCAFLRFELQRDELRARARRHEYGTTVRRELGEPVERTTVDQRCGCPVGSRDPDLVTQPAAIVRMLERLARCDASEHFGNAVGDAFPTPSLTRRRLLTQRKAGSVQPALASRVANGKAHQHGRFTQARLQGRENALAIGLARSVRAPPRADEPLAFLTQLDHSHSLRCCLGAQLKPRGTRWPVGSSSHVVSHRCSDSRLTAPSKNSSGRYCGTKNLNRRTLLCAAVEAPRMTVVPERAGYSRSKGA